MEKDIPRGRWPLGRVVKVFPGRDGHVRVVKVKMKKGEVMRGITKVCPLEVM
ncbi:hypothetical protein HOLleu_23685 [Holothuria leucospilota]|uniref:DUF5641 domain-containing protein n=1 Tax=Holothuria leucospilota TaxID=206669 RepID=A0A9Q1BVJ3_HOLLE|nr:hypothetical protein HOLleu_23685 [Holothuria leucospilota]